MYSLKYSTILLSLTLALTVTLDGVSGGTIVGAGNGFFPIEETDSQHSNGQDPAHGPGFIFPKEKDENTAEDEEEPEIDTKFLSKIDVTNLTSEQRAVYDELIELAKDEEASKSSSQSQVQGRTFGLIRLFRSKYLWRIFKSLFRGRPPKLPEFSEPEVVPVLQQQYNHGSHCGGDFKKRNELRKSTVAGESPANSEENPLIGISIIDDLTRFITRIIPKLLFQ